MEILGFESPSSFVAQNIRQEIPMSHQHESKNFEMSTSVYEFFHYSLFRGLLVIMIELKLYRWCFPFYNYFLFLLVLILVCVSRILVRALWHFHYQKWNKSSLPQIERLWTISTCILAIFYLAGLLDIAECAGEHSGDGGSTSSSKPEWEIALDLPHNQVAPKCVRSHIKKENYCTCLI